jgi:serine/threonine protein kinase
MLEEVPDPLLGVVLDRRYEILEVIGQGGIGIVYKARQTSAHDRLVAVKVLNRSASTRINTSQRFENEARIIGKLRHPNTIKLFDTGHTPDGRLYLVTEFLDGASLSEVVLNGVLEPLRVIRILAEVSDALTEAHAAGIIHRDLKPANIFLEQVGSQEIVKVLDFGVAKIVDTFGLTAPTQIFGTPGFMSPEQCVGALIDPRADLYSLGAVAYLCLSANLPTSGETIAQLIHSTVTETILPLSRHDHLRGIDPQVEGLIMQLLAKNPDDRPPSAQAVREICDNLIKVLDQTAAVPLIPGVRAGTLAPPIPAGATQRSYLPTRDPDAEAETLRPPFPILPKVTPKDDSTTPDLPRFDDAELDGARTLPPSQRESSDTPGALDGLRTERVPPANTEPEAVAATRRLPAVEDVAPKRSYLWLFWVLLPVALGVWWWARK